MWNACYSVRKFLFDETAATEIYSLSLHDALPICRYSNHCRRKYAWPIIAAATSSAAMRSEEHTSELQSRRDLVCRLLLEKKNTSSLLASSSQSAISRTTTPSTPTPTACHSPTPFISSDATPCSFYCMASSACGTPAIASGSFSSMKPRPRRSTLFPYTTLFRSADTVTIVDVNMPGLLLQLLLAARQ